MELTGFLNGGFQPKRYRPGGIGNWSGHLPFAHDLTAAVRPSLFVELGTHYGESYFGFCQAVRENDVACSCYAVDTWVGEPQAGFYDESVYAEVQAYNSAHYSDFSYLLRSTFDEALSKFADGSIDILHIDGLHTYQAVAHDLRGWLNKVKPGGIVLMHDIMVRHADFGVWKLWDELASTGEQFTFRHDWGLGVFRKPGAGEVMNRVLALLFDSPPETKEHVRKFYALCAIKLEHEHEGANRHSGPAGKLALNVYPFGPAGYNGDNVIRADVQPGAWQHLSVDVLQGTAYGPLRIDPVEQPALIDISGIVIRRPADGEILWSAKGTGEIGALLINGTLLRIDAGEGQDFCRYFSHGTDPQLILPVLDSTRFDQPLLLDIWIRVDTNMGALLPFVQGSQRLRSEIQTLQSKLQAAQQDLFSEKERQALLAEKNSLLQQQETMASDFRKLQAELFVCRTDLKRRTGEEAALRTDLTHAQQMLNQMLASQSWKITKPIRTLSERLRGKR